MSNALDEAIYAMQKEECAQMGEPLDMEMFMAWKSKNKEIFQEYAGQTKCAIHAYLQHHLEHPEAVARAVAKVSGNDYEKFESLYNNAAKAALQCLIADLK